jgi:hypothetical protein
MSDNINDIETFCKNNNITFKNIYTIDKLKELCDICNPKIPYVRIRKKDIILNLIKEHFLDETNDDHLSLEFLSKCNIFPKNSNRNIDIIKSKKSITYYDIIDEIKKHKTKKEFFNWINDGMYGEKGWKQEAIFKILLYCNCFEFEKYDIYDDSEFNKGNLIKINSIDKYFKSAINCGGSASDTLLCKKEGKKMIIFTSKNKENENGEYDVNKITHIMKEKYKEYNYTIGIVCNNKSEYIKTKSRKNESSDVYDMVDGKQIKYIIIDQDDIFRKISIFIEKFKDTDSYDNDVLGQKNEFKIRFGQRVICCKTYNILKGIIENPKNNKNTINGSDCRFGKSYCMANDVLSYTSLNSNKKLKNILFMTSQPKTMKSIQEIFEKYTEFNDFEVINLNDEKQHEIDPNKKYIFMVSIHTIKNYINTVSGSKTKRKIHKLLDIPGIGFMIIDEFHESGDTELTQQVIKQYNLSNCIKIFYTATYNKVKRHYQVPDTNIVRWSIEDNLFAAELDDDKINILSNRHNVDVKNIISKYYFDTHEIRDYYSKMIKFYFIVARPTERFIDECNVINKQKNCKDFGFSAESVCIINKDGTIKDEEKCISYFQLHFGKKTNIGIDEEQWVNEDSEKDQGTFNMIDNICKENDQRLYYGNEDNKKPLITTFYFPSILVEGDKKPDDEKKKNSNINNFSKSLKKLLEKNKHKFIVNLNEYEIIFHNSEESILQVGKLSIEECFKYHVNKFNSKKGILLFLGSSLHTGITNNYCDRLYICGNINSPDRFYQTCSRTRNESSDWNKFGVKKYGFIVCDNYQGLSSLTKICEYYKKINETSKDTFTRLIKQKLLNINDYNNGDERVMFNKWSSDEFCDKMYTMINSYNDVLKDVKNAIAELSFNFNMAFDVIKVFKGGDKKIEKIISEISEKLKNSDGIEKGIEETKIKSKEKEIEKSDEEIKEEKEIIDTINQLEINMVNHLISLIILVKNNNNFKMTEIFSNLKDKKTNIKLNGLELSIYDIIKNQLAISYPGMNNLYGEKKEPLVDYLLIKVGEGLVSNKFNIEELEKIVENAISEINSKQTQTATEKYELVLKHFFTTAHDRKQNAEVLTAVTLVIEMISKLPKDFWEVALIKSKSKDFRILDPCVGKGVFMVVMYDELIKRGYTRKQILTEILYFADINPVNVFITKMILDPYNEFELNYYIGDSLSMIFDFKFYLVLGNPPYQSSCGNKGTGNTLWDKFVNISLKIWLYENGYLVYVHPQGWRQIDNKTGKLMLSKQILYLNMNDVDDGQKVFDASTTFDYYVLQNTEPFQETNINDYKNKEYSIDLKNMRFITNHSILDITKYLDYKNENGLIKDRSTYGTDRKWVSKIKTEEFKYPCVYSINKNNELSLRYSNTNTKGHFGITKFIVSNGSGFYKDVEGEYGCTEWAYYIKCDVEDMDNIEKCFQNQEFLNIIDAVKLTSNKYNYSILKYLKKDFWKEFI